MSNQPLKRKAQIALIDLFIALTVSTLLIIIIMFVWSRYAIILAEDLEYDEMQIIAFQSVDLLVKSGGFPSNWEIDSLNTRVIGLASSDRVLSEDKITSFSNLTYGHASKLLGLDLHDFYLRLRYLNGTNIITYGNKANSSADFIVNAQRLALYKDEKTIIEFEVWK